MQSTGVTTLPRRANNLNGFHPSALLTVTEQTEDTFRRSLLEKLYRIMYSQRCYRDPVACFRAIIDNSLVGGKKNEPTKS
jgi:hypothetical protein